MKKLLFALLLLPTPAFASACDQFFPNGKEIVVPNTKVLCKSFFATVYDEQHVANVFSTELVQNGRTPRVDSFKPDPTIPNSPTPEDYTNSGFDRGHMAPAADSSTPAQMSDTFYMTNMTPQYPSVNRIAWKMLEESVRGMEFKYAVTGAVYKDYTKVIGKHKVPVPTMLYKVVYLQDGTIKAFKADNVAGVKVAMPIDINELENITGIKFH